MGLGAKFKGRARSLRVNQTDAEAALWYHLRNRQFLGFKFVRQLPIDRYIADFACREANLIVEVDGGQHADSAYDAHRSQVLAEHGYEVVRYWNNDVLTNIDGVLLTLSERLANTTAARFKRDGGDA